MRYHINRKNPAYVFKSTYKTHRSSHSSGLGDICIKNYLYNSGRQILWSFFYIGLGRLYLFKHQRLFVGKFVFYFLYGGYFGFGLVLYFAQVLGIS